MKKRNEGSHNSFHNKVQRGKWTLCGVLAGLLILLLAACGQKDSEEKIRIVTTNFPLYDWAAQVTRGSDKVELTFLQDTGVDLHSFQPTAADMVKIASCDLFIYVGGVSDGWVADALKSAANEKRQVLNLMEILGEGALQEEEKEGMQEDEHPHDHEEGTTGEGEEHEHEEDELDEHVWLSLKNASLFVKEIAKTLSALDETKKETYTANAEAYCGQLEALQKDYEAAAAAAGTKTLLFGDRFPFLYLTKDLGLDYFAAFKGCSAESEASFETIVFLAGKADELGLKVIIKTESSDGKLAETIKQTSQAKDQTVLTLDSLQSVTKARAEEGISYLSVMKSNLEVLKEALK